MRVTKKIFTRAAAKKYFLMNLIEFFLKVYTFSKPTLTALFFVEKQRALPFKAGVHFRNFSTNRNNFLSHENIFQGSE